MFLHRLADAQKRAFLSLALELIYTDDRLCTQEEEFVRLMCLEMGITLEDAAANKSQAELCRAFGDARARMYAMLELIGIAVVDDDLDHSESKFLEAVATQFEISSDRLRKMTLWVKNLAHHVNLAETLLAEEGGYR